jgi:hypothetical protein
MTESDVDDAAYASGVEALLLETLGARFLAYVLNDHEDDVQRRLQGGSALADSQESILRELIAFLGTVPRDVDALHPDVLSLSLDALGEYRPDLGRSWARAARLETGGDDEVPASHGSFESALLQIAADVYPLCLLPRSDHEHFGFLSARSLSGPVFRHPKSKEFERLVMDDPILLRLFPEGDKQSGAHGAVYRSTGTGGGIQLSMFASGLLENAWQAVSLDKSAPTLTDYGTAVLKQFEVIRRVVAGKRSTVKALVGVTGIRLPDGVAVALPWGCLRAATDADRRLIPPGLSGQLVTTTESGKTISIDYAGDSVMEMDVPYEIKIGVQASVDPWPTPLSSEEKLDERLETLRLALLLAGTRATTPVALGTWRVFLDPLAIGLRSSGWQDPRRARSLVPIELSKAEAKRWADWIQVIDERRVKSITVAIRRTLYAAAERVDATDGLVDAVIAWENLVGSSQGETTLRISAALAWLLGKNADERREIRKQVADLYKVRSAVVHGSRFLKPPEAEERRREALDIALRALRALFKRPDLLSTSSTERSVQLILGGKLRNSGRP